MDKARQLLLPFDVSPAFSPEHFYDSSSNAVACSWIHQWPEWPQNALIIYGPAGCGKTHLGHVWQNRTQARWLTPEEASNSTPFSLVEKNLFWIVDQAENFKNDIFLLHLYNLIQEKKGGILFLSAVSPTRWPVNVPDLRSRLQGIPTIAIMQPDDQLLKRVLGKLFEDQHVRVSDEVIDFLVRHMERSFAAAQHWVNLLNQHSLIFRRPITVPLIKELGLGFAQYQ